MPLSPGTRLGAYTVVAPLGAGGMGEVYRARDARLEREVAVKVLPAAFARDPDRLARFEREAKAVAALSHPNVLSVFDTGTAAAEPGDGEPVTYVAMELLTGETLGERLRAAALPVRKATEVARLIARGLAAAHDKGLVHRDLKPDNVFLTDDGQVKLLDFGLARQVVQAAGDGATLTQAPLTDAGTVLGTVGYMAPEQVRGAAVDHRADLFALGAVLYEMLSGERAFKRDTAAETMTAILHADPPEFAPTRAVPPALDRIVRHCLEKAPAERFQTARDVAFALETLSGAGSGPQSGTGPAAVDAPSRRGVGRGERVGWLLATAALAGVAAWLALRPVAPAGEGPPVLRASITLPSGTRLSEHVGAAGRLAVSPDGRRLAFVTSVRSAGGAATLWVQALESDQPTVVSGAKDPSFPVWSPDGRQLAFFDSDGRLLRSGLDGRAPDVLGTFANSAAQWAADGRMLIWEAAGGVRLLGSDGQPRALEPPPIGRMLFPTLLPGGRQIVFAGAHAGRPATLVRDTDDGTPRLVLPADADRDSVNVAVVPGYLLFTRQRVLTAWPFDIGTQQVTGDPVTLTAAVEGRSRASAAYSVSPSVIAYQPARSVLATRLLVLDRTGRELMRLGEDADYSNLQLSSDATQLLLTRTDASTATRDVWVMDVRRGIPSRLTFDPADERSAIWTSDGRSIVFRRGLHLYSRALAGGEVRPFVDAGDSKDPMTAAADGSAVVYRVTGEGVNGNDLWVKPIDGPPRPVVATPFNENNGMFSPDGRWLAYQSDESGQMEVYVIAYPSLRGKWRVSAAGGQQPRWRADGREVYFLSPGGEMMAAPVRASEEGFEADAPQALFRAEVSPAAGSQYDVTADGQRFVVNTLLPSDAPDTIAVVVNWQELMHRR